MGKKWKAVMKGGGRGGGCVCLEVHKLEAKSI